MATKTSNPNPPAAAQPAPSAPSATPPATPTPPPPLITTTANGSNHGTKVDLQAVFQALIAGLLAYYQPDDVFKMSSGDYTRDELVAEFHAFVTACQNTKASNQQWRANVQTERSLELHARELRSGVRGITQARFGATGAQNMQFGFTLPKPRKKSAETKAVAVEKSKATRIQRHTMGSVQKKDIKGNVNVALVVTPGDDGSAAAAGASGAVQAAAQGGGGAAATTGATGNGAASAAPAPAGATTPAQTTVTAPAVGHPSTTG